MSFTSLASRRLPALAAICLLSVALPATPALAQAKTKTKPATPATLEVDYAVSIPSVDAVESTLSNDILSAILTGAVAEHADELAGLDAASITVPEIMVTVSSQRGHSEVQAVLTFSDLVLTDVVDGVAGNVSLGGVTMQTDKTAADFGIISAANLNIGQMLAFYGLVDAGDSTALETIYTDFHATGGTLTGEDLDCLFRDISGAEFKARPLKTSFVEMMAMVQALEADPDDFDPALIGQVARMYADILTAFETSEVVSEGLSCAGVGDGRGMDFDIARMVIGGMSPGIYPAVSMDGLSAIIEGDGSILLDNFTFKPFDFTDIIALLETLPDDVDEAWFDDNARLLIPAMEGFSFAGLAVDVPDPDNEDLRIQASVGAFDLTLGAYRNGIPTDVDISSSNFLAPLPEDTGDEALEQLRALGLTEIDTDFRFAAAWNEASNSIDIEEASFSGVNLASITLAGTIANATADLFDMDENTALMAAMGVAVKSLNASVVDEGLSDLIVSIAAAEQGGDAATLRPIYADLAKGTVIGMLAGVADAAKMGDAVAAFVSGTAKTLEIGIIAKDDPGLGMVDFMAAEDDPMSLLGKVNISAEAK
jgi:hypothetical protein